MKIILVKSGRCQMYLHYYLNLNFSSSEIYFSVGIFLLSVAAPVSLLCQPGVSSVSCLLEPGGSYSQTLTWISSDTP